MSEDQMLLFVGSYAPPEKAGIHVFKFDASTGSLIFQKSFSGVINPSFLTMHPNGRWLYAVSETGLSGDGRSGAVYAFHVEREPLKIEFTNQRSTDGDYPCHLSIDKSGRWLLAANYGSGSVAVFPIQADGVLGEISSFVEHKGQGPNHERQESAHAHSTTLTPDNRFVIIADLGIDQLVIYRFDHASGHLLAHAITNTRPGAGPRHCVFHSLGRRLYVANELDNTVTIYGYDGDRGLLHELQTLDTLPLGAPENSAADIHFSPLSGRVYVSNRGHNSIAVFAVDAEGKLESLGFPSCGGDWPRNFGLSSDGRFVVVANRYSNDLSVLPVQVGDYELGPLVTKAVVSQPSCVQFVIQAPVSNKNVNI
jgi:6-phosphogluconolactonase